MHRPLPPGFPLPSVDKTGRAIAAGAQVRIVSVRSCANGLPAEDQKRLRSYEGQVLNVLEIDRYGMIWFGSDGGNTPDFSLRPEEVTVV
jgi:sugar lactone lactonase YvrE